MKASRSRQQIEDSAKVICSTDSKHEVHTRVPLMQRETRIQCETRVLPTPKCETCILSDSECESRVSGPKRETLVLRQT